jgi:hypothetical protein
MAKVTPKENFLMLNKGGTPAYVPYYTMIGDAYNGEAACKRVGPNIFGDTMMDPSGGYDMWGVRYVVSNETANAALPEPNNFILKDIADWRKVIKTPKVDPNIDWEAMAKKDFEMMQIDRSQSAVVAGPNLMPFGQIIGFLGFNEGFMAMSEEPEEVKALLNYMADFLEPYVIKTLDYYKPDIWALGDDTATEQHPFFSVQMYRDLFKPIYARLAKPAVDRGLPVIFHICGAYEEFIPDMLDFGVTYLEPCQESNDLLKFKETYKNKVAVIGGYDWGRHVPKNYPNYNESDIRADVRATFDKYSPNGGYGFFSWPISYLGDPKIDDVKRIIRDEAHIYGRKVYGYKD